MPSGSSVSAFSTRTRTSSRGASINGVKPEFETIADGSYPVSRPLYVYIKKAHLDVISGMREFLAEYTSEKAWGDDGYLSDKGLIPMPKKERQQFSSDVEEPEEPGPVTVTSPSPVAVRAIAAAGLPTRLPSAGRYEPAKVPLTQWAPQV